jgi:hypothetical protein
MKLVESLLISLANNKLEKSWKTRVDYNNKKLFSYFLIGFNKRYENVVSYPLPIEYWYLVESEEIDKEPINKFREHINTDVIINCI